MGPVLSVRSSVQTLGTSPPSAGTITGSLAAQNGFRPEAAIATQMKHAVAPVFGAQSSFASAERPIAEPSYLLETAKARALAAQRAYEMVSLLAGRNPLNERLP